MSREQLQQDGLAGPFELADKSQLDEACEIALELKALRRQQNLVAEKPGPLTLLQTQCWTGTWT